MLGSALSSYLPEDGFEVIEVNRKGISSNPINSNLKIDALDLDDATKLLKNHKFDYVVNAIGLIKQLINESASSDVAMAYAINTEFPALLNTFSEYSGTPVIQIGTDCVYSGKTGSYDEKSIFDCTDVYGISKVRGELKSVSIMTVRSSIVGHETGTKNSLMDWFLSHDQNSMVEGYVNHIWNGVTTLDFSKVVSGIIKNSNFKPGVKHLLPVDTISKHDLLNIMRIAFDRTDLSIKPIEAPESVNRTLGTVFPEINRDLWLSAGYNRIPSINQMITGYAEWSA